MLTFDIKGLMKLVEGSKYDAALEKCEQFVSYSMTSFMEELTVDTATSFAASVQLYTEICHSLKKPWLAVPKLETCRGALRFMKDFMSDTEMLCDTFEFFASAYAYARFFPESIYYYEQIAKYSNQKERVAFALKQCFFYEKLFGKSAMSESNPRKDMISQKELKVIVSIAELEAEKELLSDPIENTDDFLLVRFDVEAKVDRALSLSTECDEPFCLRYWAEKKRILKEEYAIEWHTPAQMNPGFEFC